MTDRRDNIIILGAGGHARVLIDLIITSGRFAITGILDNRVNPGTEQFGIPVLGSDDLLDTLFREEGIHNACIGVGSIRVGRHRKDLFERLKSLGYNLPPLIHPDATVSRDVVIHEGAQVMAGAIIQSGCTIGPNSIINTGSIIDHDCKVAGHVHICPGTVLSGGCIVMEGAFIGAGATVIQGRTIGIMSTIAAGAVVVRNTEDGSTVMGVPAR